MADFGAPAMSAPSSLVVSLPPKMLCRTIQTSATGARMQDGHMGGMPFRRLVGHVGPIHFMQSQPFARARYSQPRRRLLLPQVLNRGAAALIRVSSCVSARASGFIRADLARDHLRLRQRYRDSDRCARAETDARQSGSNSEALPPHRHSNRRSDNGRRQQRHS